MCNTVLLFSSSLEKKKIHQSLENRADFILEPDKIFATSRNSLNRKLRTIISFQLKTQNIFLPIRGLLLGTRTGAGTEVKIRKHISQIRETE